MMKKIKIILLLLCLVCALALTACHQSADTWPSSNGGEQPNAAPTQTLPSLSQPQINQEPQPVQEEDNSNFNG